MIDRNILNPTGFGCLISTDKPDREPGDRWMIQGPVSYIPPIDVKVVDQGNGVFVR